MGRGSEIYFFFCNSKIDNCFVVPISVVELFIIEEEYIMTVFFGTIIIIGMLTVFASVVKHK